MYTVKSFNLGSSVSFQVSMIKFRPSIFLRGFDLFVLLSRNNLALVGQFVSVENCSHKPDRSYLYGKNNSFSSYHLSTRPALHTSAFILVFYRMA